MAEAHPSIALWFRYGPAEHQELYPALPRLVEKLARAATVHYFGLSSRRPVPDAVARHAQIHLLPAVVDRTDQRDKTRKTLYWLTRFPWLGRECRRLGVRGVFIDETVPLTAALARRCFGPNVAMTVADFFVDIYAARSALVRGVGGLIKAADFAAWRRLPLIITKTESARQYLARQGVPAEHVVPIYDPCDLTIYHPANRAAARAQYRFSDSQVVLVHHGILHPNKGNDRIIRALAELRPSRPHLRYLLIGDGPDMPRLRQLVAELRLAEMVVFTGWLKTLAEVNLALNAGDIGLAMRVGQEADNFHLTGALVHAMACGLPVLAARLAGIAEAIIEDANGLLFNPNDMSEFSEKLCRLADDPGRRARLGRAALESARELFDIERHTDKLAGALLARFIG